MLYMRPTRMAADEPLIDELTMRMTGALRRARVPDYQFLRVHTCICGAVSASTDRVLRNGAITNTLRVHYLAYHRAEVPVAELDLVKQLPPSAEVPTPSELGDPEYRLQRKPVQTLICIVDGEIGEEVVEDEWNQRRP